MKRADESTELRLHPNHSLPLGVCPYFSLCLCLSMSVTRFGVFCTLGNFLKPLADIKLPKSPTFLGNFCKGVKSFLGNFYRHLAIFFWSHSLSMSFSLYLLPFSILQIIIIHPHSLSLSLCISLCISLSLSFCIYQSDPFQLETFFGQPLQNHHYVPLHPSKLARLTKLYF